MEKILGIRDKYLSFTPNVEQVKESICTSTVQLERLAREDRDRFLGHAKKLESLKGKIKDQQEILCTEEQRLNTIVNELAEHNELLKELEDEKKRLLTENSEIESKKNQLKVLKPSVTDQRILEAGSKKFDYYKVLTGIRWDYSMLKSTIKGFVTNGDTYIHPFCLSKNDSRAESKLWKEIEKSANCNQGKKFLHKEN